MQGIIVETSTNRAGLILTQNSIPVRVQPLPEGTELSKTLGYSVSNLLEGQRCDFVAVGIGPGSYTGTRVGAAMAQSLAYGWQVPLISFCSLSAFTPPAETPCVIIVDARMGGFYCLFSGDPQARLLSLEQAQKELSSHPLFSPHPDLIRKRLSFPVHCTDLNAPFLAEFCSAQMGSSALESLPFSYLS